MRAHPRHRGGRQDHAARHVLPDERQLLLRRLLQGRRHPARVGADHAQPVRGRLRLRRRRTCTHGLPRRRRGDRAVEEGRGTVRRPHRAPRAQGQLLAHGCRRPRRPVLRDLPRPRTASSAPRADRVDGRPLPRVLEPRVHAVRARERALQGGLRHRRATLPKRNIDTGHGPRARRVPAPGRRQHLRDRRGLPGHRGGRGPDGPALRRRPASDDVRFRVVADHVRSSLMLIGDGVTPGQRGPRLRPASPAASRGALDAPARRRRAEPARSCCRSAWSG